MWKHKKHSGLFKSSYEILKGERVFSLTSTKGKKRIVTFESWQMAKRDGWVKV